MPGVTPIVVIRLWGLVNTGQILHNFNARDLGESQKESVKTLFAEAKKLLIRVLTLGAFSANRRAIHANKRLVLEKR